MPSESSQPTANPRAGDAALRPAVLRDLFALGDRPEALSWEPLSPGVTVHWIYRDGDEGAAAALIRFEPGARVPLHEHRGYEHIFVLNGSQADENGRLDAGDLMIHAPGTRHRVVSGEGCLALAIYERRVRFLDEGPSAPV